MKMKLKKSEVKHFRVVSMYCNHKASEVAKWYRHSDNELIKKHTDEYFEELRKRFAGVMPCFVFNADGQVFPKYTINDFLVEKGYMSPLRKFALPINWNVGGGSSVSHHGWYGDDYYGEEDFDNAFYRFFDE